MDRHAGVSLKRMLVWSAVFHAGLVVPMLIAVLVGSPRRFSPDAYQVDLVSLPSFPIEPAVAVKESPAAPPPVPRRPVKKVEAPKDPARPRIESEKRPMVRSSPPPKPIEPAAAVPPSGRKPSEPAAAIPPSGVKVEAKIEAPGFKYPYYLIRIQEKIGSYWLPPPLESTAERREAVVSFVLFRTGIIDEIKIEKSSGNAFMDQAALRAVYQARPMPPFPQGSSDEPLKVHFSFSLMKKS
ncbi:MAG: TonB family protein [Nitrospirae bacterium]|nr:TonB family protein [Nitrospirota bacterium]